MLLFAPPPSDGAQNGTAMLPTLLMMGAVILIFYFMMIRPQQKRQKEHRKLLESIKKGDTVITTSGIHGLVYEVSDTTVVVTVGNNMQITFDKSAIASVESK